MFIKGGFFKGKSYKLKIVLVLFVLLVVAGAHGTPIIRNQVEDSNIVISQVVGGQPDVLVILDLSGSMEINSGGASIGQWNPSTVINSCEFYFGTGTGDPNMQSSHCIENVAGTDVCGSKNCIDGICDTQSEFNNELTCIQQKAASSFNMCPTIQTVCGGSGCTQSTQIAYAQAHCTSSTQRADASAAIEAAAGLTQCMGAANCKVGSDTNPACDTSSDYSRFKTCATTLQAITANKASVCTGGTPNCQGILNNGTERIDMALDVFYSFLDADNSLSTQICSDPTKLFDGVNLSTNCKNFMNTPFRNVNAIVKGTSNLPTTSSEPLINELTNNDATLLGIRIRPMNYSGVGNWSSCTSSSTFNLATTGGASTFAGASGTDLQNVWQFYRSGQPFGGTPLAYSLGFSDTNSGTNSGTSVGKNALYAYLSELQTDPSISCRPEFVVVITDGEDTCSGQCSGTSGQCSGSTTTNANRRSTIQAISNLRTFYARNPVTNKGKSYKKEIYTFVIGLQIQDPKALSTLNAMALAGGTSNLGVIKHTDPNGNSAGDVAITDVLPSGSAFQVFMNLAQVIGINTNPSSAQLQNCKTPVESGGSCAYQSQTIFDDNFFNTGAPFPSTQPLNGFAFVANNPQELTQALQSILGLIQTFSTSGISPAAPQSSTSVALRDRVFLSILTPITSGRLWQGRLGLYSFIDDPNNIGSKKIVDNTPQQNPIVNSNGSLNQFAQNFYWEAGKQLAERDITNNPRNLFTVNTTDNTTVDTVKSGSNVVSIRYRGERASFDDNLPPSLFGITNADVNSPIPSFCTTGGIKDCTSSCTVVTSSTCQTCVTQCLMNDIVSFMSGNTNIQPTGDPMGSMGTNCPSPAEGTGSFATCSVRLGDIFHSNPIVVGSPSSLFFDTGFQNFAGGFLNRTGVVYVGANDGFLHAFNAGDLVNASSTNPQTNPFTHKTETLPFFSAGDGTELFGFAPPTFLADSIKDSSSSLAPESSPNDESAPSGVTPPDYRFGDFSAFVINGVQSERSFFDGSPLVADVWIDGYQNGIQDNASCKSNPSTDGTIDLCGKEWHTVLLSGFKNGGGAYMALDITNVDRTQANLKKLSNGPDYPRHLWTTFDKNFGNEWSDPTIGRVQMKTKDMNGNSIIVDRWVMFVGGGADPSIPPENFNPTPSPTPAPPAFPGVNYGNAFYVIDIATGNIIFKFAHDTTSAPNATVTDSRMICDMPSKAGAFDLNADGFIDVVYEGDTCGRVWRFDVSEPIIDAGNDVTKTGLRGTANITTINPSTGTSAWTGDIAFCANTAAQCALANSVPTTNRQPIFFAPTVVLDDLGLKHVLFITGDRRDPTNIGTSGVSATGTAEFGKLYNFIDSFVPAFLAGGTAVTASMQTADIYSSAQIINLCSQSGLSNQFTTSVNNVTGGSVSPLNGNQGQFVVNFPNNVTCPNTFNPQGEKGFGSPIVINRVLVFTTFAPSTNLTNPCTQSTGVGNVFAIDYISGQPALARIPGATKLIQGSSSQQLQASGLTVAQGMPTPARLTFGARGSLVLTVAFSGNSTTGGSQFLVWQLPPFPTRTQTLFWEQIF